MITHIVLGKVQENLSEADRNKLTDAVYRLRGLPGVERFSAGPNFSERSKGYTYGLVMYFTSRQDLDAYLQHEEHLAVVEVLNQYMPERLVADFEWGKETDTLTA